VPATGIAAGPDIGKVRGSEDEQAGDGIEISIVAGFDRLCMSRHYRRTLGIVDCHIQKRRSGRNA
jgi:hypothetical protein